MTEWLAVIVICSAGECRFWADTKTPYTKEACEAKVIQMTAYFAEKGIEPAIGTCLPLRFIRAEI